MIRLLFVTTLVAMASPVFADETGKCASEADAASLAMSVGMNPVLRVLGKKSGKPYLLGVSPNGGGLLVAQDPEGCYRYCLPIPHKVVQEIRLGVGEPA